MQLRTMTKADIPAGMRLKEAAGWNQTEADWKRFLEASPQGCFVGEQDGTVQGTAATISFEGRFAWIGMVLVDPDCRGRGIGTALLKRCIDHLDALKLPCVKLDATPLGKPIYEKLGFVTEFEIERWTLQKPIPSRQPAEREQSMPLPLLEHVLKADREAFGADRSELLRSVHAENPEFTDGLWNAGGMEGYLFGRHGSFADHLGPWVAKDERTAEKMLVGFLARTVRQTVVTDCLALNPFLKRLLAAHGFAYSRPLSRMYRGQNGHPGKPDLFCSILGPEFG